MNRHSILFKLNILFAIALIATLLAGFSLALHTIKKEHMDLFFKSRLIVKEMRMTQEVPHGLLEEFGFIEVKKSKTREIISKAREQKMDNIFMPKEIQHRLKRFRQFRKILFYEGYMYMHLKIKGMNLLLENRKTLWTCCVTPVLIFAGILVLLVLMYTLLRRSLIPLKKLQHDIESYGNTQNIEAIVLHKKDEVSLASNAFYASVEKLEQLKNARQLFIRNIFHELNTPVTKGKILAEIVDESKTKMMLESIFNRLSMLLKELAEVEKISSRNFQIEPKPIRIQELIDEASDLLYLQEEINTNVRDEMIVADFTTMSIVFKNLIDNACKYGQNIEILWQKEHIYFISEGDVLDEPLKYYTEAFSKGQNTNTEKGFGLGLYIVSEILIKHKMHFEYAFEEGKNRFSIGGFNIV